MQPRKTTIERFQRDLIARNLRSASITTYMRWVSRFIAHLDCPPSRAKECDVRDYMVALQKKYAPRTVNQAAAALRCFYTETLRRPSIVRRVRNVREEHPLPTIISGTEVARLLAATESPMYRALLLLMYGAGLRVGEACALRVEDIDSKRMMLRIRFSKSRPRDVPLSPRVLQGLRDHWRATRPKGDLLFPGELNGRPLCRSMVGRALNAIQRSAGLSKHISPHDLRHAYATHLLDTGADVRTVQMLMGHSSLHSTLYYTRSSRARLTASPSPVELLGTPAARVLG